MLATAFQKEMLKFTGFVFISRSVETVTRLSFTFSHWSNFIAIVLFYILCQDNCEEWTRKHLSDIHSVWKRGKENEVQVIEIEFTNTKLDIVIILFKIKKKKKGKKYMIKDRRKITFS